MRRRMPSNWRGPGGGSCFRSCSCCSWRWWRGAGSSRLGFRAPPLVATAEIDARIRRLFPFELTAGQQAAIREVAADMARETPMNRLLQGDVGSGKTVVAVYAMLLCVAHGYQAALMAPTEILARQHADTLAGLLRASRVRHLLLTGRLDGKASASRRWPRSPRARSTW